MNANELADELENTYPFVGVMEVAATMLRQQQTEINTLRSHGYKTQYELLRLEFLQQQAEIEALKDGIEKLKDAYCQKDHEIKKAEQYCLDAFERGRQIGYADGMINRKAQEK